MVLIAILIFVFKFGHTQVFDVFYTFDHKSSAELIWLTIKA